MKYIEDITRWSEHMKIIFEWKKYFTISSQRVIFFLLHRYECFENYTHFTVSQTKE